MDKELRIITRNGRIITLKELFKGKDRARRLMASLPFEEKIKVLISLQKTASGWGGKKDVVIWRY